MTFDQSRHLYLEEVEGEKALDTVRQWNKRTLDILEADPLYSELHDKALTIANSDERIPSASIRAGMIYNFWQDEANVRGLWRRTSFASYASKNTQWEILLDVDDLAERENRNWVFKRVICTPDGIYCLIALSDGGKDAVTMREFDTQSKRFVNSGFVIPQAKTGAVWVDADTLLVSTDWGQDSLTESGYPYIVKLWRRGQALADARQVLRGQKSDVGVWPVTHDHADGSRTLGVIEADSFFTYTHWTLDDRSHPHRLPLPAKSSIHGIYRGSFIVSLREDWQEPGGRNFVSGDLIAVPQNIMTKDRAYAELVIRPGRKQAVDDVSIAAESVLIAMNDNVSRVVLSARRGSGGWRIAPVDLPEKGNASIVSASVSDRRAFLGYEGFLTPDSLYRFDSRDNDLALLKSLPEQFTSAPYVVEQFEANSSDGQVIPYFVVRRKDMSPRDGPMPTLLYGYGGFQISLNPTYSGYLGRLWLDRGGVYVLANIRGGGEFGPQWHQAGLKTKRQIVYDDFIAVAEHLIKQKLTTSEKLGIMGGSNGGLLMGVMYTQRPDLFSAVVCQVPLLDMLRYHTLLAGASWVDEYGSPNVPEERAWLEHMSPYHNVDPDDEHPQIFFVTSTKDDRVHPGHARKMAKRLEDLGKKFLYYENIDGGHSAAANRAEAARRRALEFTWLARILMDS